MVGWVDRQSVSTRNSCLSVYKHPFVITCSILALHYCNRGTAHQLMTAATTVGGVFVFVVAVAAATESGKTKCVDSVQCMNNVRVEI